MVNLLQSPWIQSWLVSPWCLQSTLHLIVAPPLDVVINQFARLLR